MRFDLKKIYDEYGPFNGSIHIGAKDGQMIDQYERAGFNHILWLEKEDKRLRQVYSDTRAYNNVKQQYHQIYLSDEDNKLAHMNDGRTLYSKCFQSFHHDYVVELDLRKYDFLFLNGTENPLNVLKGFGKLFPHFRMVYLMPGEQTNVADIENFLIEQNFDQVVWDPNSGESVYVSV